MARVIVAIFLLFIMGVMAFAIVAIPPLFITYG